MLSLRNYMIEIETKEEGQIKDITDMVEQKVEESGMKNGIVNLFVQGTTASLIIIENESGLLKDFYSMLERVAPKSMYYEHEKAYRDGNGHSHVRSSLLGQYLSIPFLNGSLALGRWQSIAFVELDIRPRRRSIVLQLIGE
jgi:secondary thiamine-phosphate synthase enzyme